MLSLVKVLLQAEVVLEAEASVAHHLCHVVEVAMEVDIEGAMEVDIEAAMEVVTEEEGWDSLSCYQFLDLVVEASLVS